ncbi:BglG family transcription antiterminator [Paenibacillus sp. P96]|uniref:BglG family transcription antiterminator n=1 Tax=Paenibacillus zeirhizosphaerae TaxID=2987519 RepID=A0ABT9FN69_9BACL|nr:BglG family transcription antiterminator [Paenibacillus sp. P96]MDP4096129.1 BglG family transcription antiterminator [Paenibacillus sp. P96]
MNERQREILQLCLRHEGAPLSMEQIAARLGCSEKTIRKDFKIIDGWLAEQQTGEIIRRPNRGIIIRLDEEQKNRIEAQLLRYEGGLGERDRRRLELLRLLLLQSARPTIDQLKKKLYVSRNVITEDLGRLGELMQPFRLRLVSGRQGIEVDGMEEQIRAFLLSALADFTSGQLPEPEEAGVFGISETRQMKHLVHGAEERLSVMFTPHAFHYLVLALLTMLARIKLGHMMGEQASGAGATYRSAAAELAHGLEKYFAAAIPETEVVYIGRLLAGAGKHLDNGQMEGVPLSEKDDVYELTVHMIDKVATQSGLTFQNDQELLRGLSLHLYTSMPRLKGAISAGNPLLDEIKRQYYYLFDMIVGILQEDESFAAYDFDEHEAGYIVLHFQAAYEKMNKYNGRHARAMIVCSMGVGISMLLKTKLDRKFDLLEIAGVRSERWLRCAKPEDFTGIDFVLMVRDLHISKVPVPVVRVNPLFTGDDERQVRRVISKMQEDGRFSLLGERLTGGRIVADLDTDDPFEAIRALCALLEKQQCISPEYADTVIQRETRSPTVIGGGMMLPHGEPALVYKNALALARLQRPVSWGGSLIRWVLLLAHHGKEGVKEHQQLIEEIVRLSENDRLLKQLEGATRAQIAAQIGIREQE